MQAKTAARGEIFRTRTKKKQEEGGRRGKPKINQAKKKRGGGEDGRKRAVRSSARIYGLPGHFSLSFSHFPFFFLSLLCGFFFLFSPPKQTMRAEEKRKPKRQSPPPPPSTINTRGVESVFFDIVVKKESTVCFLSVFPSLRGRRSREMSLRSLLAPQQTSIFFARGDGKRREEEEEEG